MSPSSPAIPDTGAGPLLRLGIVNGPSRDLIPRDDLVDALLNDSAKVVVIPGESGAGKSILLREAAHAAEADRYVAPIYKVMWADPLLAIILDALGGVVAQIVEEQTALERVSERFAGALERLVETKGRELVTAAGAEILRFARSRLGPEAGEALGEAVKALQAESAESVGARLGRTRPTVARELIVGFVAEIVALADGRPVLIPLDRCERLKDDEVRLLADLAEVLPDGAQIWAATRDDSVPGRCLPQTDASVRPVPPLDEIAVGELLASRGLPPGEAQPVVEATRGTALDVQAYLQLLQVDQAPSESEDPLTEDTQRRVALLSATSRDVVGRIAALSDPLPASYLVRLADGNEKVLAEALLGAEKAGLLSPHGDQLWIHERRRTHVLASVSDTSRRAAIGDAARAVWEYVREAGADPKWLVELAELVAEAPGLADENELVRPVLEADEGQLAVLAGLIELTEEAGTGAVEGHALLSHVRASYPTDIDELVSLRHVEAAGLGVVVTNEHAAAVVLRLGGLSYAVALGRIGRIFGTVPVPAIASAAFNEIILPRIEPFHDGQYGVGAATLRTLSHLALGRTEDLLRRPPRAARRQASPALLLRASFASRPLYGAFRFDNPAERDRALDAMTGLDIEFLGERLSISTATAHPMIAVPADRFVQAAERIVGKRLRPTLHEGEIRERLDSPLTYEELVETRVRVHQILRELAGAAMRGAMELDQPISLHWMSRDESYVEVEVRGGRSAAIGHEELPREALQPAPYQPFHLARALGLRADEDISRWTVGSVAREDPRTGYDPVLLEIGRRREVVINFNHAQRPLPVTLDDGLISLIQESHRRELADARALAAALPVLGRTDWRIPPVALYVVIGREEPNKRWAPGARSGLVWAETPSPSGEDECHVVYTAGTTRDVPPFGTIWEAQESELDEFPRFDSSAVLRAGSAIVRSGVARLLGYLEDDLDLRRK